MFFSINMEFLPAELGELQPLVVLERPADAPLVRKEQEVAAAHILHFFVSEVRLSFFRSTSGVSIQRM